MVKSFKNFARLDEAILIRDEREEGKPFVAGLNGYGYGRAKLGKYLSFHAPKPENPDRDWWAGNTQRVPSPEPAPMGPFNSPYSKDNFPSHNLYFSHNHGVLIDPQTKTVNLDRSKEALGLNRRYNVKLGQSHERIKTSVPILDDNNFELKHEHLRQLLRATVKHHPDAHNYDVVGDERFEGKKVHQIINEPSPNETWIRGRAPLVLYHGTSSKKAATIRAHGLQPGQRDVNYADYIKGYSEHNVYLTANPHEAANYATREAIHDGSRSATILRVEVQPHEFHRLTPDEDTKHWFGSSTGKIAKAKLFAAHPETREQIETHGFHYKWLDYSNPHSIPWTDEWVDSVKPAHENADDYKARLHSNIKAAFGHLDRVGNTVGFKGSIHPKHISHHKTWKLTNVPKDPSEEQYFDAQDKMRKTVKRD